MDLAEILKKKRPNLSAGSIRTYKSILSNLYRKCYPEDDEIDVDKLNDEKHMLDHLKDIPFARRKTTLAALVVLTGNKHYSTQMLDDIGKYNDEQMLQQKDGKFAENMIPFSEVEAILKRLEADAKTSLQEGDGIDDGGPPKNPELHFVVTDRWSLSAPAPLA